MASNERPGDDDEENGIDWQGLGRRLRVDKQTARTVVEYVGPHLSWIVAAIAMWLGIKREDLIKADKDIDRNDPNAGAVV